MSSSLVKKPSYPSVQSDLVVNIHQLLNGQDRFFDLQSLQNLLNVFQAADRGRTDGFYDFFQFENFS